MYRTMSTWLSVLARPWSLPQGDTGAGRCTVAGDARARPPHAGRRRVRSAGFTLLEMLAVILLIGIAAAAVSVSVSQGLTSARANAASVELAAALRQTRTAAIVSGKDQTLEVDTRQALYRANGHEVRLPAQMRVGLTSAREDQVDADTGRIRFFPDGSSTGGRITLQRGQRQWHVNVAWLTGAVSVVDTAPAR
jgi:general secretion pathway protein H